MFREILKFLLQWRGETIPGGVLVEELMRLAICVTPQGASEEAAAQIRHTASRTMEHVLEDCLIIAFTEPRPADTLIPFPSVVRAINKVRARQIMMVVGNGYDLSQIAKE